MSDATPSTAGSFAASLPGGVDRSLVRTGRGISSDSVMAGLSQFAALTIFVMLFALLAVLTYAAWPSIPTFGWQFLVTSQWRPNELSAPAHDAAGQSDHGRRRGRDEHDSAGVRRVAGDLRHGGELDAGAGVCGAAEFWRGVVFGAAIAAWLAVPVSFLIEFLAAIPSIAYGMWGLFVLAPFLQHYVEPAIHSGLGWIPGVNAWLFTETARAGGADGRSHVAADGPRYVLRRAWCSRS